MIWNPRGSFAFQRINLQLAVLGLIEFHSMVNVVHPVAQHAIDQSGQFGGHGFDGDRSSEVSFSGGGTLPDT